MQQKPLKKNSFKFVPKCAEFCSASDEYLNTLITLFQGGFYFYFLISLPLFVRGSATYQKEYDCFSVLRLFFVGARNGHLPGFLATINMNKLTPFPSLLFGVSLALTRTPQTQW